MSEGASRSNQVIRADAANNFSKMRLTSRRVIPTEIDVTSYSDNTDKIATKQHRPYPLNMYTGCQMHHTSNPSPYEISPI